MVITAAITYALLYLQKAGYRPLELAIGALVGVIGLSYLAEMVIAPIAWSSLAREIANPSLPDGAALTLAVGIIGATVMPHALFLHSGLTQARVRPRSDAERLKLVRYSNLEVVGALTIAGLINVAMVMMAAGAFHAGHADVAEIESAYQSLTPLLGGAAAGIFLLALIASGIASSVVGTMAGQMIMQGFVRFKMPLWLRRAITIIPSFVVVGCGLNVTKALVMSQVVLSLALPFPMIALVFFAGSSKVVGAYRASLWLRFSASLCAAAVLGLNVVLVYQAF
jgi:manganese transport protein